MGFCAIDGRTTRHAGYRLSHRKRKLVEQAFGWMKTVGLMRKLRIEAAGGSPGSSPSPRRRTTWSAGAISWRNGRDCDDD